MPHRCSPCDAAATGPASESGAISEAAENAGAWRRGVGGRGTHAVGRTPGLTGGYQQQGLKSTTKVRSDRCLDQGRPVAIRRCELSEVSRCRRCQTQQAFPDGPCGTSLCNGSTDVSPWGFSMFSAAQQSAMQRCFLHGCCGIEGAEGIEGLVDAAH